MNSLDIECELATRYFDERQDLIVPNVSWGYNGFNECDLLICTKAGYLIEVEIKISRSDLKADQKKKHKHNRSSVKEFYFAIPSTMEKDINLIPEDAGIILVYPEEEGYWANYYHPPIFIRTKPKLLREAVINKNAKPIDINEKYKLARLGALRIWKLKKKILKLQQVKQKNES